MADLGHLEKMGRELKCPICLSLLNSTVSLPCNHVFCNSCILKSMKSVSDCPVCKVPFRRREVRASPHMDNLVSVYRSMEVALGVNIFTTQVAPPAKTSEEKLAQSESEKNSAAPETKTACVEEGMAQVAQRKSASMKTKMRPGGKSKGKGVSCKIRQKMDKSDVRSLAKKRIVIMPYPVSETPLQPEKLPKSVPPSTEPQIQNTVHEANGLSSTTQRLAANELGEQLFTPFFWLREKDDDDDDDDDEPEKRSSQQTQDASPTKTFACFSDIKDSDDDITPIKTPSSKGNVAEVFDSEMFEWTQRACSPELSSTPLKKQTAGGHKLEIIQEKYVLQNSKISKATQSDKNAETQITVGARKGAKKRKRPNCKAQRKNASIPTYRSSDSSVVLPEIPVDSKEAHTENNQESKSRGPKRLKSLGIIGKKRGNKTNSRYQRKYVRNSKSPFNDIASAIASEQLPIALNTERKETQKGAGTLSSNLPCLEDTTDMMPELKSDSGKRGKRAMSQVQRKRTKAMDDSTAKKLGDISVNTANEEIKEKEQHNLNISIKGSSGKQSKSKERFNNRLCRMGNETRKMLNSDEPEEDRRNESTTDVAVNENPNKKPLESLEMSVCEKNLNGANNLNKFDFLIAKSSTKNNDFGSSTGEHILRKCASNHSYLKCAFCQSSDDTEVSGKMMHYFNGKPVASDYNGGINVIHAHKSCTEWAPDVYFDEELVINLAAELTRSRRIKCSCCGLKGAALGCFEKSCRKSFHFTCARMTPECRWDNDNFVMLCPLHLSSKLPNETFKPLKQRRKGHTSKVELQSPIIGEPSPLTSQKWTWPSGLPCKWVFCCSGLTGPEKEIISEFTKFTGISISKSWTPAVTHIIASTDENGACRRTLKFLKGILDGKWILSIKWIKACMEAMEPAGEEKYEITLDVHGISGGPRQGRLRICNNQPKLFKGFRFYFTGDFQTFYKGYLQDLVLAAGGTILQRKPISRDHEKLLNDPSAMTTFIIYSLELPEKQKGALDTNVLRHRQAEAQALADASGAKVAGNTWLLDSIAACKLQPLA